MPFALPLPPARALADTLILMSLLGLFLLLLALDHPLARLLPLVAE